MSKKQLFLLSFSFLSILGQSIVSHAQIAPGNSPCVNPKVNSNLIMLNEEAQKIGFKLSYFTTLGAPNGEYTGIPVTLDSGNIYKINFAATPGFKNFEYRIADRDKKEIVVKKIKNKPDVPDYYRENIVAAYTGVYYIVIKQKVGKGLAPCVGLSILTNK